MGCKFAVEILELLLKRFARITRGVDAWPPAQCVDGQPGILCDCNETACRGVVLRFEVSVFGARRARLNRFRDRRQIFEGDKAKTRGR